MDHIPLFLHHLYVFVVALEFDARLSESYDSAEKLELSGVSVGPSRDLNFEFIFLR